MTKQNVTISLDRRTGEREAYERAERQAMLLLDQSFHLGGVIRSTRDEWHDR